MKLTHEAQTAKNADYMMLNKPEFFQPRNTS